MFEHILIWKITTKNDNVQQRIESIQKDFVLFSTNVTLIIVRHSNKTWAQCKQTHFIYGYLYIYRICKQKQEVEKKAASKKLLFPRERHTHRKFITNYKKKREKRISETKHSIQNGSSANESEMNIRVKHLNASTST